MWGRPANHTLKFDIKSANQFQYLDIPNEFVIKVEVERERLFENFKIY